MLNIDFSKERDRLVQSKLRSLGIQDEATLAAMKSVPREEFLPEHLRASAYHNRPLPIGEGQTISQPFIVALMTEALQLGPNDRVLEVGTGSGYGAAILSRIAAEVDTVERFESLAQKAQGVLVKLQYNNVHVYHGDGSCGLSKHAPFDAIVVTAAGPSVPSALLHQLRIGGRLVLPVGGDLESQQLVRVTRRGEDEFDFEDLCDVHFVPLVGEAGWRPDETP